MIGTAAMLWVGGHIILVGTDELGLHFLYGAVHHLEEAAKEATGALGSVVGWLVNTLGSALLGLVVGALIVTGHDLHGAPAQGPARRRDRVALADPAPGRQGVWM